MSTSGQISELRDRWALPHEARIARDVVKRLSKGGDLRRLGVNTFEGKLDLRGLSLPGPTVTRSRSMSIGGSRWDVEHLNGVPRINRAALEAVDLSYAVLAGVMIEGSVFRDCRLDGANLEGAGLWGCDVSETSFATANLRDAVLGGTSPKTTRYERVDFRRADLRLAIPGQADFFDCDFSDARLDKVEFYGCRIERCRFAGRLREVIFNASGPSPANRQGSLVDVDFTGASLHGVGFQGYDLDRVRFPTDEGHLVLQDYPCTLERALAHLASRREPQDLWLAALLEHDRKWLGPRQQVGVLAIADLHPDGTLEAGRPAAELLTRLSRECRGT